MMQVIYAMGRPACEAFPKLLPEERIACENEYPRCQVCGELVRPGHKYIVVKTEKADDGPTWQGSEKSHEYILCTDFCRGLLIDATEERLEQFRLGTQNQPLACQMTP